MAFETSTSADVTLLGETWDVAEKVISTGKVEIGLFVVTLIVALLLRSTRGVGGGAKKMTPPPARSPARRSGANAQKSPQVNVVAQLAEDSISMRCSTSNVLSRYLEIKSDHELPNVEKELAAAKSPHTVLTLYQSLIQCACRGGQPRLVETLLDDMESLGCARPLELYESAMRLLAAKKDFKEALMVNDRLERDGLTASPVTQSCLVSFSAELGMDDKTIYFFERLCKSGPPSVRACMVVLRVHSKRQDWAASVACLRSMLDSGVAVDSICLNIVLATGVTAGKVDEAEALLSEIPVARIADTVSYNTMLKGLAQKGLASEASRLFDAMDKQGVQRNVITFNTVIDAAVRARKNEEAWRLYDEMRQSPTLKPDKCTCSTLVKALQQKPTPDQIESVLELVSSIADVCQKDLTGRLLSGILDAALRISDLKLALQAKTKIIEQGFALSEVDTRSIAQLQARRRTAGS